jgi:aspartate/methionine/tyrosine aminotransferase
MTTMKLETFQMERMQSEWENRVPHNLSESGVHPMTVEELLEPSECLDLLRERLVYPQSNGSEALRAAVAALYPGAEARNVVVTNGTAEANYISIWKLVEPGDEALMMLPNYMQIWGVVRGQGGTVVPWRLREEQGWAPDLDELSRLLTPRTRLVVVCNPNNPTGAVLARDAMSEIVARVARHGAWLLADEVYRGAEREGDETPSFWGSYERVLVTAGLSKAYALPGLRVGWVVGPADTIAELWGRKDYLTISPGALSDVLARKALRPDVRARVLARTRGVLRANYPVVGDWARAHGDALRIVPPRAGAIAYARYAWPFNSTELVTRLRDEHGVLVVPGDHFGMDRFLRIGFGNEAADLRAGLARIDAGIAALSAGRVGEA